MDCGFSEGSIICQIATVVALIRDLLLIIAAILLIAVLVAAFVILRRSFRIVKDTSGRVTAILDQVDEGIQTVKDALGVIGNLRRAGAGSSAVSGGRSTFRAATWLLRPIGRVARRAARRSRRPNDSPASEAES